MRRFAVFAAVCGALLASTSATPAQEYGETVYRYCYISKAPYGEVVFFSGAFGVPSDTYHVGIQNAFNSYVSGRHDSEVVSGALCMGPYATMAEAREALNDHLGERRRAGKRVVLTHWRYRGD